MVDFSKIKKEDNITHLFVPMSDMSEIRWLLDKADVNPQECYLRPWKQVLNHEVPAICDLSDEDRDNEIDAFYGEDAEFVKLAPAVLISYYNVTELAKALNDTLFGYGDADYNAFKEKRQAEIDAEDMEDI